MNILAAIDAMREGKSVSRPSWPPGKQWTMQNGVDIYCYGRKVEKLTHEEALACDYCEIKDPKLRPCPFCGGPALINYDANGVLCEHCKAYISRLHSYQLDDAIETWNTRVGDDAQPQDSKETTT